MSEIIELKPYYSRCRYKRTLDQCLQYLPSDFVTQRFSRDDGNFFAYPLISVEVQCQSSVIFLNDDSGGFFDSLRPNTTLMKIFIIMFNLSKNRNYCKTNTL